jgi:hypothetical protein
MHLSIFKGVNMAGTGGQDKPEWGVNMNRNLHRREGARINGRSTVQTAYRANCIAILDRHEKHTAKLKHSATRKSWLYRDVQKKC